MKMSEKYLRLELWHKAYNLDKKDNLHDLPSQKAVFGIFAIVDDQPSNCRYVGQTEDLQQAVKTLFEKPEGTAMKNFMQGPWIQMIQYTLMPDSYLEERQEVVRDWERQFEPKIGEEGDYPGYYD
jgi:hypothetical protein